METSRPYEHLTDAELIAREESLYDTEVEGDTSTWFIRDQVLWEMNYRGLCD
jgi:hypothetical protein